MAGLLHAQATGDASLPQPQPQALGRDPCTMQTRGQRSWPFWPQPTNSPKATSGARGGQKHARGVSCSGPRMAGHPTLWSRQNGTLSVLILCCIVGAGAARSLTVSGPGENLKGRCASAGKPAVPKNSTLALRRPDTSAAPLRNCGTTRVIGCMWMHVCRCASWQVLAGWLWLWHQRHHVKNRLCCGSSSG